MTTFQTKLDVALLLESAAWPAFLVDPSGIVRRVNNAALEVFGNALHNAPVLSLLSGEPQTDAVKYLAQLERTASASMSLTFKVKDGNTLAVPTSVCAFTRQDEKRFLFQLHGYGQALKSDTLSIRKADTAAPAAAAAAKQKADSRATQLARSVALDLNNTLTSITGHCSWILSEMEPDHKWRKSMEEIAKAAGKSAEIAENLASFSRSDKEKEASIATNINALLKRLQQDFHQAYEQRIQWTVDLEEQLYHARCDENKLQQVFTRVLENAVQSSVSQPRISVQTRNCILEATLHDANLRLQPGCYICVEITDNGKGIPPEILPRVFEPFFSTKPGHKGLGLAWVYGAVTNTGGGVAISSLSNQGTSVRLYVPAHKRVSREAAVTPLKPEADSNKTILLVDDEDLVLGVGRTVLSASGYKVLTALSGQKALEILREHKNEIKLVICDWIMPQLSGKELMQMIRTEYPSIAVLCTSGYAHVAGTTGHTDFLQKPFTTQKLLDRVKDKLTPPPSAAAA